MACFLEAGFADIVGLKVSDIVFDVSHFTGRERRIEDRDSMMAMVRS